MNPQPTTSLFVFFRGPSFYQSHFSFGDFTSFENSSRLMAPSPDASMVWKSRLTFRMYWAMSWRRHQTYHFPKDRPILRYRWSRSFSFCLKARSSSELAVFIVCWTKTCTLLKKNFKSNAVQKHKTQLNTFRFIVERESVLSVLSSPHFTLTKTKNLHRHTPGFQGCSHAKGQR